MTGALVVYAATFSRYALAVTPKNYLLFGCHVTNFAAQSVQGYRYLHYWKYVAPFLCLGVNPLAVGGWLLTMV
jgi:hypothetical protein